MYVYLDNKLGKVMSLSVILNIISTVKIMHTSEFHINCMHVMSLDVMFAFV